MDIILIPGLWLDGGAWSDVLPGLREAGHNPVPVSLPGQGDGADATLEEQLEVVLAAVRAAAGPALVVGHSGHCTLAWLAADRLPSEVAAVAMIGGMPAGEGDPYFDAIAPVDAKVSFPGWDAFAGPDSDDLKAEMRVRFEAHAHPASAVAAATPVHYTDESRYDVPVIMVCPEYSPDDAREWLRAGHMPGVEPVRHLSYTDLDTGHWPMFSNPALLASTLAEIADLAGRGGQTPWEPPIAGSEADHLLGMLNRLRATFRWKADGLGIDGLRLTIPSSDLSLGVLLQHLTVCEDDIFAWRIGGQRPESLPEGELEDDWQFRLDDAVTAEALYGAYDAAVARSMERQRAIVEAGRLDEPGHLRFGDAQPSIRRHICDLIEEYGRHTGHADLIREAVDGRVGEDPPPGWQPG